MIDHDQLFQRIKFQIELKNYPEALIQLRREVETNPEDGQIHFWLGIVLAEIKEYREAKDHLKLAKQLDPENQDIDSILEQIELKQSGDIEEKPIASHYFNLEEPQKYKKKLCPDCAKQIAVESWKCGYCKHIFYKRIIVTLTIMLVLCGLFVNLFNNWYSGFMGYGFNDAFIVNKAGEDGERILISDAEWNCTGLGLTQHRGTGYRGHVKGKIKNIGDRDIEKAVITIVFQFAEGKDFTFVWFDVYDWASGLEMNLEFPGISPPYRPKRCELRIESVVLVKEKLSADVKPTFYVPWGGGSGEICQFPSYKFSIGEELLAERQYAWYKPADPWSFKQFLSAYLDIIPPLIFNFFCILAAVILVNICEAERKWNTEFKLDVFASAFVVIGFIPLNVLSHILGFFWIFAFTIFLAKMYLFYLFFKRSIGFTILMIIFYICVVLSCMGLWYNITGAPKKDISPPAYQLQMGDENMMGGMGGENPPKP